MNVLVILGHPRPGSFNHAIAHTAVEALGNLGHDVVFHDLCAEGFEPDMEAEDFIKGPPRDPIVAQHCAELAAAEGIVIVHPNWWGQPPAVLKGWIDRVIRQGVAYEFVGDDPGAGVPQGLLAIRAALVLNTSDTPAEREMAVFGDPLDTLWRNCVFGFCGVTNVLHSTFSVVVASTPEQRRDWLAQIGNMVEQCFPQS